MWRLPKPAVGGGFPRDRLSHVKRPLIARQKATYCNAKDDLLQRVENQVNTMRLAVASLFRSVLFLFFNDLYYLCLSYD